jgi:hypothetical protein
MDSQGTETIERNPALNSFVNYDGNTEHTRDNLARLLELNAEYASHDMLYKSSRERLEAESIGRPLTPEKAFAYLGLLTGTIPPISIFVKALAESSNFRAEELWILVLMGLVVAGSAATGYFTGKLIGKIVNELEKLSWHWMILALPFIGLLWGIISGGAGGIFLFIIGAVFGAMIGGMVGSVALTGFAVLHRIFKKGEIIELKIFLPLAVGITSVISALILGS